MKNIKTQRLIFAFLSIAPLSAFAESCDTYFDVKSLVELKEKQFIIENARERNKTAEKLISCLGHKNPNIRDGVIYEGLSHWLRGNALNEQTIKTLFKSLTTILSNNHQDQDNFTQPFASLVLAEVVRVDRITPYLSKKERQEVVDTSTEYMSRIKDYRGFNNTEGWRHAVAHTSDIFLQLALNENMTKEQLSQLLSAIGKQVSPANGHSYIYGESKRLATAFAYIVLRGEQTEQEIGDILNNIASSTPFSNWGNVYQSESGLAKLHNTRAFIYSLLALSSQSKNPHVMAIQPTLTTIIRELG